MEKAPHEKAEAPRTSRIQLMRKQYGESYEPEMPELMGAEYVLEYLFEVGPVMATGMGPVPISFSEIATWQTLVGIELQPWEAKFIRRLSLDYLEEYSEAENRNRVAPWGKVRAQASSVSMRDAMRGLSKI